MWDTFTRSKVEYGLKEGVVHFCVVDSQLRLIYSLRDHTQRLTVVLVVILARVGWALWQIYGLHVILGWELSRTLSTNIFRRLHYVTLMWACSCCACRSSGPLPDTVVRQTDLLWRHHRTVSERNLACVILVRRKTLSDGEVKVRVVS